MVICTFFILILQALLLANSEHLNCDVNNGGCEYFCHVILNRVVCTCPRWYHLGRNGKHCVSDFETGCKVPKIVNGEYGRYIDSNFQKVNKTEIVSSGEALTLRCDKDYATFPSTKSLNNDFFEEDLKCDQGEWSKNISCKLIACRVPDIKNGEFVRYTSPVVFEQVDKTVLIENKQILSLRCHEGYVPFPRQSNDSNDGILEEELTCENGIWSKNLSCLESSCSYVPRMETNEPAAVNSSHQRRSHGHVITYAFWDASILVEKGKAVCHFGNWIFSSESTNKSITCPVFESTQGIEVIYTADLFVGSHAIFKCSGNILKGNTYAVCLSNGTWSHSLPSCKGSLTEESVTCSEFASSPGLLVSYSKGGAPGSIAIFTCSRLTVLEGNTKAICLSNGTWSKSPPLCKEPAMCEELEAQPGLQISYSKGISHWSKAMFTCSPPKVLIGSSNAMCLNGYWSHSLPKCEDPVTCPMFESLPLLKISYSKGLSIDSKASFSCSPPNILKGNSDAICMDNGVWSHSLPNCIEPVTCTLFEMLPSLKITVSKGYSVGSNARFSCEPPKILNGNSDAICMDNGVWSHSQPNCIEPVTCKMFELLPSLKISYSKGYSVGSNARFSCEPPKILNGNADAICMANGVWSHSLPKCIEPVTCKMFEPLPSLKISYSKGLLVGSNASFSCEPPKILNGNPDAICMANGVWSHSLPKCIEPVICQMFDPRPSLKISYSNGFSIDSKASFICSPPSVLDGVSEATCTANGLWSHSLPQCTVPLPCSEFRMSLDLKVSYSKGVSFGSEARFSCSPPKVLIGNPKAECLWNGSWSQSSPECKSVSGCLIQKSENSVLNVEPVKPYYTFGEKVILWCPNKMTLTKNVQTMMCLGSDWSDDLPDCKKSKFR